MARAARRASRASRRKPRRGSRIAWVSGAVVVALAASGAAAYESGLLAYWFGHASSPPLSAPVPGFSPPAAPTPSPVMQTAASPRPSARLVRRALASAMGNPHLDSLRAVVAPLTGHPVLDDGHGLSTPASTLKLLTTTAALQVLGPDRTFATRAVTAGRRGVVLVGGGDPFLESAQPKLPPAQHDASLQTLAARTARALRSRGVARVRLGYDASLFTGPRVDPHWPRAYIPDGVVSPITALWVDEGLTPGGSGRVADPPATAAAVFATYLRKDGVHVAPRIVPRRAGAQAHELARVTSPPVADIVERVLQLSDNEGAEVLAHQVGLAVVGKGSFTGGVTGVRSTLRALGIPLANAVIQDGSGLSRHDRLDVSTLVRVLQLDASPDHPGLRSVVTGLPVAAYEGSLADRFLRSPGRGVVRAKTGTLTGTSALAGITTDARGNALVFAFVSNHVPYADTLAARAALDHLATVLATCRC